MQRPDSEDFIKRVIGTPGDTVWAKDGQVFVNGERIDVMSERELMRIRGDLGILFTENLVHGSDSLESAEREINIFFPKL